jgi:hypothetical protein
MPQDEPHLPNHPLVVGVRLRPGGHVYDFDPVLSRAAWSTIT